MGSKKVYEFQPVGFDLFDRKPHHPAPGQRVVLTQPPNTPKNGTMGHVYVADAETGAFHGLVLKNSLQAVGRKKTPPAPPSTFNDRRRSR